jgi:hypothetical protein
LWNQHFKHPQARSIPWWEQVIWSAVAADLEKSGKTAIYPRQMNWSRVWWANYPHLRETVIILHDHGPGKWENLKKMPDK